MTARCRSGIVHDLLGRPLRGGMLGHVEVDDPPATVSEHDEDEEDAEPTAMSMERPYGGQG